MPYLSVICFIIWYVNFILFFFFLNLECYGDTVMWDVMPCCLVDTYH